MKKKKAASRRSKKYSRPLNRRKDNDEAVLMKASLAHREGRLDEAAKGYLDVLQRKPDRVEVLNALGTVFLHQSRPHEAREVFEKAVNLNPSYLPACYNLAWLKQRENDHKGAIDIYRSMLAKQPDNGLTWNNLGVAYRESGDPDETLSCFQKAVGFAPDMAEAWNNLGVAQDEFNMPEDAAESYGKAIAIRPDYGSAHFNLGLSLQKLRRFEEAEAHYKKALQTRPDDEAARFMLQSLGTSSTPDAAPVGHVRRIFDRCAGTFERILVKDLEYRTPELLFELVHPYLTGELNVLDLGCGTGLGARLYRPFAKRLTGVDVSPKMLEKAEEKKVYDRLEIFDILQDWDFPQKFDLIYGSDVFVYFGNLDTIISSASSYLVRGGIIVFSVERLADSSMEYQLFPSGRYAHSRAYIQDCLKRHGLRLMEESKADIRKESGKQVKGLLIVAKKAG
ncbi:MAG: tetratricopeptide repeat protein [Deltaproteobacteria bacterium]|jgi:predicted TPR repeat methyltransferase|nr:tetratricopeptide repeat protein [Deltaproteobacteria bacterium]